MYRYFSQAFLALMLCVTLSFQAVTTAHAHDIDTDHQDCAVCVVNAAAEDHDLDALVPVVEPVVPSNKIVLCAVDSYRSALLPEIYGEYAPPLRAPPLSSF